MVKKTINTKFISLTLSLIFLCTLVIGGIAFRNMSELSKSDSVEILNLLVEENASDMDALLGRIEQSVDVLAGCANDYIYSHDVHTISPELLDGLTEYLDPLLLNAAHVTEGCIGVYIRYNTDIAASDAGLFFTKSSGDYDFISVPCTDISLYEKDDIEHVGWYYIPRDAGVPTWMLPYYNSNIDEYMISYIIPLYVDDMFIGIIGMDIDFDMIEEKVSAISAYQTGRAYLTDSDFNIIYHPILESGTTPEQKGIVFKEMLDTALSEHDGNLYTYELDGVRKAYTYRSLRNGQNLCIAVNESDINRNLINTITHIVISAIFVTVIFVIVTVIMCRTITKPLHTLTDAAMEISQGKFNIEIPVKGNDEIGVLASALRKTTEELNVYIEKMNRLAYLDSLTGVENKTAYDQAVVKLQDAIKHGKAAFAVAVLDLNDLKKTNDTLGHYYGDMLISNAARLIQKAFVGCPVYRIGGDEFVVILDGINYKNRKSLYDNFVAAVNAEHQHDRENSVSIAYGMAEYMLEDMQYSDVFSRADEAMYKQKKIMKDKLSDSFN